MHNNVVLNEADGCVQIKPEGWLCNLCNPQPSPLPSVCAALTELWLKGRLGLHPAVKTLHNATVLTPCTCLLGLSIHFLWGLPLFCFKCVNALIRIWVLFCAFCPVCGFNSGPSETLIGPCYLFCFSVFGFLLFTWAKSGALFVIYH